jgi:hypothetical protein
MFLRSLSLLSVFAFFDGCKKQASENKPVQLKQAKLIHNVACEKVSEKSDTKVLSQSTVFSLSGSKKKTYATMEYFAGPDCQKSEKIATSTTEVDFEGDGEAEVTSTGISIVLKSKSSLSVQCFRESELAYINNHLGTELKDCKQPVQTTLLDGSMLQVSMNSWLRRDANMLLFCASKDLCDINMGTDKGVFKSPIHREE